MKKIIRSSFLFLSAWFVGCSSIFDTSPSTTTGVTKVEDYYLPLKNIGRAYEYCRKSVGGSDTVWLTMQGKDPSSMMPSSAPCYLTDISKTDIYLNNYYYAMNDTEAYTLGKLSCGALDKYWLDLKAPLALGQTWTFSNANGSYYLNLKYTAKVTRRGVQMKMPDGKKYEDVIEVVYTSNSGDSTVKWFAKGVGLLYSISKTPDSEFGGEMWLVGQK